MHRQTNAYIARVHHTLFFYGIQLHHLNPNGILQIACFITLCERFLGTKPRWALWKRIFVAEPRTVKAGGAMSSYGGAGIRLVFRERYVWIP